MLALFFCFVCFCQLAEAFFDFVAPQEKCLTWAKVMWLPNDFWQSTLVISIKILYQFLVDPFSCESNDSPWPDALRQVYQPPPADILGNFKLPVFATWHIWNPSLRISSSQTAVLTFMILSYYSCILKRSPMMLTFTVFFWQTKTGEAAAMVLVMGCNLSVGKSTTVMASPMPLIRGMNEEQSVSIQWIFSNLYCHSVHLMKDLFQA